MLTVLEDDADFQYDDVTIPVPEDTNKQLRHIFLQEKKKNK